MATRKKNDTPTEIEILKLQEGRLTVCILGQTPLIYNAMSNHVKRGLLLPKKKTAAERASSLKHDPLSEFRSSVYRATPGTPTLLSFPAVSFKRALASAALDIGGAKKAQVERLVWAIGEQIPIYGIPHLRMDVTRSADMARTPDVRTRAILPAWACKLTLAYVEPTLNATVVSNLLAAAGLIRGIGDYRQEKGAGNYGQFSLVEPTDPQFKALYDTAGREAQEAAMNDPQTYDAESEELLAWWHDEVKRRGQTAKSQANGKASRAEASA